MANRPHGWDYQLSFYIQQAYGTNNYGRVQIMDQKAYQDDPSDEQPRLKPNVVNRVLLFPGSFNPPHQGHVKLLQYVFDHARDELNIVATIVVLTDEKKLQDKTSDEDHPLVLTRRERISLWRGTGVPLSQTWIYDRSQSEWAQFRRRLEKSTRQDGINLQFIMLVGPDSITSAGITDPKGWNCRECITSDISRPCNFRSGNSLRQLSAHTVWKKLDFNRYALADQMHKRLLGSTEEATEQAVSRLIAKLDQTSLCSRFFKPKGKIYFIPSDTDKRGNDEPSSSRIRALIGETSRAAIEEKLEDLALNAKKLIEYIRQRPPPRPRVTVAKPRKKTAEEIEAEIAAQKAEAWRNVVW